MSFGSRNYLIYGLPQQSMLTLVERVRHYVNVEETKESREVAEIRFRESCKN